MSAPIRLKKDGTPDMRGRSAGSRKTQFKSASKLSEVNPFTASPQERVQLRRIASSKATKTAIRKTAVKTKIVTQKLPIPRRQEFPHRRIQQMIDEVYEVPGKSIRKSLMGMAQRLGADQEYLLRIKNATDAELELTYREEKYLFESYWEYPIYLGDNRDDTLDQILAKVGV